MAEIQLLPVSENKRPPYWNCTSGFDLTFSLPSACALPPNFIEIGSYTADLWRHSYFQDGGRQPCWIWFWVMVTHPQSASGGLCFILKFRLDRICSFGDRAIFIFWLKIAYSHPLLWGFGGIFSLNHVIYHRNPQKALSCAETRRLSHKAWKSVERFDLCAGSRKKDSQKSHKSVIFTYLARSPHWTDFKRNLHSSCRPRGNHMCKFLNWNCQGLRFYRGSNFQLSYRFLRGPYNSAALLRSVWFNGNLKMTTVSNVTTAWHDGLHYRHCTALWSVASHAAAANIRL